MPIYEYRCTACEHKLEAIQKFSDAPLVTCPVCAKNTLTKLVSAAGFQLKGSGWYQTDFRGGGTKAPAKTDAAATDGKSADASVAKSDATPETKTDSAPPKSESATATPAAGPPAAA
jgi:putative FmdB family regulatory protein